MWYFKVNLKQGGVFMENNIDMNGEFTILGDNSSSHSVPPVPEQKAAEEKPLVAEKPVGFWTFIGLFLLFAIPLLLV